MRLARSRPPASPRSWARALVGPWLVALLCVVAFAQDVSQPDTVRIGVLKDGAYQIVTLPLETYVARVLAGEALPGSDPAAQEALAIAIRTYTAANRNKHRADGFDLCDQTHCQVMRNSTSVTERAAAVTRGQILTYLGAPAQVYYSASCGGHTEKPSNVWPGADDLPYLPSRADDGCAGMTEWSTELTLGDLQTSLQGAGFRGTLRNVRVGSRNESERVAVLLLDGLTPDRITGQDLRAAVGRTLGWQYVRSTAFELTRSERGFRLRGRGYGHGVGMCVIGSTKLAAAGQTAAQILARYYPGTTIGRVSSRVTVIESDTLRLAAPEEPRLTAPEPPRVGAPPAPRLSAPATAGGTTRVTPDLAISLPEGDEGERPVLAQLVMRERQGLASALGVAPPPQLSVRVHPTTNAYEAATGQPWFTLGAVVGSELHFAPLSVLRSGGVLERTVRHQMVHVLADAVFAGRPTWVREGAAVHFAEQANGPGSRGSCPLDAEFAHPVSPGALGDVYARARACFERQLTSGRRWQDVR